ncbi:MAG: Hsp20/alpha crystallin family protein [Saprospiraceae bacterium]|nr:Hsp20/alpha crystallin family protein [Saprospiraceae bacterium]
MMCNNRFYKRQMNQNRMNDYYGNARHEKRRAWKDQWMKMSSTPRANVLEKDEKYELHLFAPGYIKSDFTIALIDQKLTISVKDKESNEANWKRKEYSPSGFVRQFALNEDINSDSIEAVYENGVLIISLPKLEGHETKRQEIEIS